MDRGYQCEVNRDTWVSLVCLVFFVLDFWRINMYSQTGREILKANVALERALALVTKENRGEVSVRILTVIRNLNDNIAQKIWMDLYPDKPRNINKVAKEFCNVSQYRFIGRFDKFLRKSVSHFTPSEDGAERLMLKYYQYTLQLKKTMWERYGVEILNNIENFLLDTDEQTSDYYNKVAEQIKEIELTPQITGHDNYYVNKIKPFFVEQEIYYEITLEPANDKPNKFNRITAFTKHDILENYSVALKFVDCTIDVFGVCFPIKIICEWHVSIRPCEINNFARILGYDINIQRSHTEYRALMRYLTEEQVSLVEIIDFEENQYNQVKNEIAQTTRKKTSVIFELLDECRERSKCNEQGKNILRYLLHRMNNGFIRDQWPGYNDNQYADLYISAKCRPFDKNPYSFNPKGHLSTIHELSECIDTSGREGEIIARNLENNAFQNGKLFTPIEEMRNFGCDDEIINIIEAYNASLYRGFKPDAEIGVYKGNLFKKGHEREIVEIVKYLKKMSKISSPLGHCFCEMLVDELKELSGKDKLDEIEKEHILKGMFSYTKVFFVYGAAGTGKTTLVNHISNLLQGTNRLYLAKTNPAVENMKRKIWALLLGLAMLPTVVLPVAAETSTPTLTNLYTLDFENADTSKAVAATDKELFATWLPSEFDASLMTVANGGDSWQYEVVSEAPSNSGNALKFISTAKPSSGTKYLEMKTPTAKDDYSDISTGANGAAIKRIAVTLDGKETVFEGDLLSEELSLAIRSGRSVSVEAWLS